MCRVHFLSIKAGIFAGNLLSCRKANQLLKCKETIIYLFETFYGDNLRLYTP